MAVIDRQALEREVESARGRGIDREPLAVLEWAHGLLGEGLMMSTAFGKSGMVILHMVHGVIPDLPIYFLDTGFHFQETMDFVYELRGRWGYNIKIHRPRLYGGAFRAQYGEAPYETDPDLCCHKNKVEPFADLLERYQGWIAGLRRDQGASRSQTDVLEVLENSKLKVNPLVHWTRAQVEDYIREHGISLHPLFNRGYTSIGCEPCTAPASNPADERAGRWAGKSKTECGLHLFWKKKGPPPDPGSGSAAMPA